MGELGTAPRPGQMASPPETRVACNGGRRGGGRRHRCVGLGRWLAAAAASAIAAAVAAAELTHTSVSRERGVYVIEADATVKAEITAVRRLVLDHNRLHELSPVAVQSRVLGASPDGGVRLRLDLRPCIWVLCRSIVKVSDVEVDGSRIVYTAVPALGDFDSAVETLTLHAEGSSTRLAYRATLAPSFFLPAFIGTWALGRVVRGELSETARRIERAANEQLR